MVKKVFIKELKEGQVLEDLFVLVEAQLVDSKNGPFWDLKFQDKTGVIYGRIWHPQSLEYSDLPSERVVKVRGQVRSYKDRLQIIVDHLETISIENIQNISDLIPSPPIDPKDLLVELENLCKREISYLPWRKLCLRILKDKEIREIFLNAPAAKSIHHAYRGGLVEHTLNVAKLCVAVASLYPNLDKDILIVASVLHDIGKGWELKGEITFSYTDEGNLLGHIIIGLEKLENFFKEAKDLDKDFILHLKHIILSHHGEYEFGSPKRPMTVEALVFHFLDNLDAKINSTTRIVQDLEYNDWSSYQYFLERRLFRPLSTPTEEESKKETGIKRCLLPLKE